MFRDSSHDEGTVVVIRGAVVPSLDGGISSNATISINQRPANKRGLVIMEDWSRGSYPY